MCDDARHRDDPGLWHARALAAGMTSSTTNLLDLPHAILEHVATELPLPGVGCYACVCSLLRQLITANAAPCWHVHLDACKVASDEPRPALRALTTLDCARWIDVTPRFVESDDPHARPVFSQGQPDAQVAHTAFTCNDGNTLIIVGVQPRATVLSAWAVDVLAQPCRWREAAETTVEAEDELLRDVGVDQPARRLALIEKALGHDSNPFGFSLRHA